MWNHLVFPLVRGTIRTNNEDAFEVFPHCCEPLNFARGPARAKHLRGTNIWPGNLSKWFLNTQEWKSMLSRASGQIFFLAALPSSDLAAFQSGRQRQSPASDCLRAWESNLRELALIVFILLHFNSVHLLGPSSIIALTAGSSLLQVLFFSVCRLTAFPVFSSDCLYWCSSNVSFQNIADSSSIGFWGRLHC